MNQKVNNLLVNGFHDAPLLNNNQQFNSNHHLNNNSLLNSNISAALTTEGIKTTNLAATIATFKTPDKINFINSTKLNLNHPNIQNNTNNDLYLNTPDSSNGIYTPTTSTFTTIFNYNQLSSSLSTTINENIKYKFINNSNTTNSNETTTTTTNFIFTSSNSLSMSSTTATSVTTTTANAIAIENEDCMDEWAYNAAAVTLFFIGFFGFTFNIIVIILMIKNIKQWTPTNAILLNLVCSDFSVSIFGNPFTLISAILHKWIFGKSLCILYGFFMALLGITSITTLTVLAYERYCLIKFPLSATRISNRNTVIRIIFIWSYSLALTTPPLFGWGAYVHEAANISCSVNWESKTFNATTYIVFLFIFGLVIPLIVITYSYVNIISTMKMSAVRLGRKNRAEKRINVMVAVMIFAFMLAWTPYSAFALLEQFGPIDLISPQMAVLPALIAKSSICYNPLIYVGLNPQLRNILQKKMTKEMTANDTTMMNQLSQNDSGTIKICNKFRILVTKTNNTTKKFKTEINHDNTTTNHIDNDDYLPSINDYDQNNIITSDENNSINTKNINMDNDNDNDNDIIKNVENLNLSSSNNNNELLNLHETTNIIKYSSNDDDDDDNSCSSISILDNNILLNNKNNDVELAVFIDGKSKLIKSDLYSSNIC